MLFDPFVFIDFAKILKGLIIGLEIIYGIFSFIMTRQIKLMNESLTTKAETLFLGFARIHLLFVVGLILLSILLF